MQLAEEDHIQELYNAFKQISTSSSLAESMFEMMVHCKFSYGWWPTQLIHMTSDGANPPTFTTGSSTTSLPDLLPPSRTRVLR